MKTTITKPYISGSVRAISSKSQAHRLLICAALSASKSTVVCSETSADIDATVRCLNALGAQIVAVQGGFEVSPVATPIIGERILYCGESGSTLRFMLPVCAALGAETAFFMDGRLPVRPLSPLYEELISHGCALSAQGLNPLHLNGRLAGGRFTIPGNISSQYISGLLLALPMLTEDSLIDISGTIESKPYIDMTLSALKMFGITLKTDSRGYRILGNQKYTAPDIVNVEGDWSNAAFWLCAGALGTNSMTVTNLDLNSLQGDKNVLTILERFGAKLEYGPQSVTVSRGMMKGIEIDAGNTPDLVPILAAVASTAEGETVIINAGRLRIKESDRLKTVSETLSILGADIKETEDGLIIRGKQQLSGGTVSSHGDHRIAMTAAIAAAACTSPVTILDAEAVNKSYPGFFADFCALGGAVREEK